MKLFKTRLMLPTCTIIYSECISFFLVLHSASVSSCLFIGAFNFHQEKFNDTIKECTKALELNPSYIKALFRRAEAHEKLEHYEEAIAGMVKCLFIYSVEDLLCYHSFCYIFFSVSL